MRCNYLLNILISTQFLTEYLAFQPKPTPSSIIQNFADGNLWLDNRIPQEEHLVDIFAPEGQDLLEFDENKQNGQNHYLPHGLEGYWDSQSNSKESHSFLRSNIETGITSTQYHIAPAPLEHVSYAGTGGEIAASHHWGVDWGTVMNPWDLDPGSSHFNEVTCAYQTPEKQTLVHDLDEWLDIQNDLGSLSGTVPSNKLIKNPMGAMDYPFQTLNHAHCKFTTSNVDHHDMLAQANSQYHKCFKNMCNTAHDPQVNQVPRNGDSVKVNTIESSPYHFLTKFPSSTDTVDKSKTHPSNAVNSVYFPESLIDWHQKSDGDPGRIYPTEFKGLMKKEAREGKRKKSEGLGNDYYLNTDIPNIPRDSTIITSSEWQSSSKSSSSVLEQSEAHYFDKMDIPPQHISPVIPSIQALGKDDHIGIKEHPMKHPSLDLLTPPLISKLKKDRTSTFSTKESISLLHNIGVYYVNNSPSLCYETHSWFERLKHDMMTNENGENLSIKAVEKAIRFAHSRLTTSFLALIVVFANNEGDQFSLNSLMNEGWAFICSQLESWRKGKLKIPSDELQLSERYYTFKQWNDPVSWYRSLSTLGHVGNIPVEIMKSLVIKWNIHKPNFKIGGNPLGRYYQLIQEFHDSHIKYSHGGFYSRAGIRNISFPGLTYFGEYPSRGLSVVSSWHEICLSLSQHAQFHSSDGIDLCEEVHSFFSSLIEHLLNSYRKVYNCDISQAGKRRSDGLDYLLNMDPHQRNIETIIRVVSMAEYRLTVIFIGLVKVVYQKEVEEEKLRSLLKIAWEFLKGTFSKWKKFQFDTELPIIFNYRYKKSLKINIDWSDPYRLFDSLSHDQDISRYPIPINGLKTVFEAWSHTLSASGVNKMHGFEFKIKLPPPDISSFQWAESLI
ncbi:hypothetical protein DFH28DRAFT_1034177 [Melampsora americana]|nr:hypothetical protein DFH28DRAFT_1034177 [Melampsora americana]